MKNFTSKLSLLFLAVMASAASLMAQTTVSRLVNTSTDDMEEYLGSGAHDIGSSDLEIGDESPGDATTKQLIGLRFTNLTIPQGAIIVNAYIQFTYDNSKTADPCVQVIKAEAADNSITFTDNAVFELANKPKTTDSVVWTVASWAGGTTGTRGPAQRTSDIKTLVQAVVNRSGWASGNAMSFYLLGTGTREAESFEGAQGHTNLGYAPELVVVYATPVTVTSLVNTNTDDMEEYVGSGTHDIGSSDLEIGDESPGDATTKQITGLRFTNIGIPANAQILNAYMQFTYDNSKTADPCVQVIKAEANDNPATFTDNGVFELAVRPKTNDSVVWTIASWAGGTTGTRGPAQRSSDIKTLVQSLVNRPGWASGNAMAFYLLGSGTREAESYEGAQGHSNLNYAPELVIQYAGSGGTTIVPAPTGIFPIDTATVWAYRADSVAPPANWNTLAYNDSIWPYGPAQMGYGDGDEATVIPFGPNASNKYPSYYFRHRFTYNPNVYGIDSLIFNIKRDDGAVVYLNGVELFRSNMPAGPITYNTLASSTVGGSDENAYFRVGVPATALINGLNLLAVSVHQDAVTSSDLSFQLRVTGKKPPMPIGVYPLSKFSAWKFLDQGIRPSNWETVAFNDSNWDYGFGALGYGDPVTTPVSFGPNAGNKYITTYFRRQISIPNVTSLPDTVDFNLRRDDGAVVYVNGTEVFRSNMPTGPIDNNTFSSTIVDGAAETTYFTNKVPKSVFVNGLNTIAIEIHQRDGTSSDKSFDLEVRNPLIPPPAGSACIGVNDSSIGCFTSVQPTAQTPVLVIPSSHRFQRLLKQGDPYTKTTPNVPFLVTPGNNDFTAYVGVNGSSTQGVVCINHETTPGGVTILDVRYNASTKLWIVDTVQAVDFYNNDLATTTRNCSGGITPWGTIITAEETLNSGDVNGDGYTDVGWLVEIDPATKKVRQYGNNKQEKLWAMGRMSHENVVVSSDSLRAFYAEDGGTNCVYKFVANTKTNLSSGRLYVLRLNQPLVGDEPTGTTGRWILLPNTTQADRNNTFSIAAALGGTAFNGPEDVEISTIDNKVYFTSKGNSRVYRFTDSGTGIGDTIVTNFETFVGGADYQINYGTGIATEAWGTGNDNLTFDERGNLWVLQDGSRDHVWMVTPSHNQGAPNVSLFATTPAGSEPCGFQFTPNYRFGFLSLQSPSAANASSFLIDAKGDTVRFDRSTTVAIARSFFLGSIVSGLDDEVSTAEVNRVEVYPNPTEGILNISIKLNKAQGLEGRLTDMTGKTVFTFNRNELKEGENTIVLDLRTLQLNKGYYLLQLEAGEYRSTRKISFN
jgi:secreted PhoX family phosphatase